MADDRGYHQREENPHQGASHSFGRPTERAEQRDQGRTGETAERSSRPSSDLERTIRTNRERTNRERDRSTEVGRRRGGSPAYGSAYAGASPFALMRRMADDMDRLFENFGFGRGLGLGPSVLADSWRDVPAQSRSAWAPQVETFRRGDTLVVRADLPGLSREDVDVEVEDGILAISGERSDEHRDERDDYFVSERSYGSFYRAIPLPEGVTGEQCDATFRDGVLEVTFPAPKEGERKAKRIEVR